jgi:uncharacterized membrane protein YfcA
MASKLPLSLVRLLAGSIVTGCISGLIGGIGLAHMQPALHNLLSAEDGSARGVFLFACMQVGAVVALAIAMIPERVR